MTEEIRVTVAPGFTLYSDFEDEDMPTWTVTGCLPTDPDSPWYNVSHYDLEDALVKAGVLERSQCDSESGQFFVYPSSEEQGRRVGAWIKERLERNVAEMILQ